jgi:hypothetical protein
MGCAFLDSLGAVMCDLSGMVKLSGFQSLCPGDMGWNRTSVIRNRNERFGHLIVTSTSFKSHVALSHLRWLRKIPTECPEGEELTPSGSDILIQELLQAQLDGVTNFTPHMSIS